jgi:hypothetical protein
VYRILVLLGNDKNFYDKKAMQTNNLAIIA